MIADPVAHRPAEVDLTTRLWAVQSVRVGLIAMTIIGAVRGLEPRMTTDAAIAVGALWASATALLTTVVTTADRRVIGAISTAVVGDVILVAVAGSLSTENSGLIGTIAIAHTVAVTLFMSRASGLRVCTLHVAAGIVVVAHDRAVGVAVDGNARAAWAAGLVAVTATTMLASLLDERAARAHARPLGALVSFAERAVRLPTDDRLADLLTARAVDVGGFIDGRTILGADAFVGPAAPDGHRLHEHEPLVLRSTASCGGPLADALADEENVVVAPIPGADGPLGWTGLVSGPRARSVSAEVLAALEHLCAHAGALVENARLRDELEARARTDGLTGLANRSQFDERLAEEIARASRQHQSLSLLVVDVDHFKAVNDNHGHAVGDDVLRDVAARIAEAVRTTDFAARYGGEEFAVICPSTDEAGAVDVAERIRHAVATMEAAVPVTVSIGVASMARDIGGRRRHRSPRGDDVTPDRGVVLFHDADAALYRAKSTGRNRVVAAETRLVRQAIPNDHQTCSDPGHSIHGNVLHRHDVLTL